MHETLWLPAVVVLCSGFAIGAVLALAAFVRAKRRRGDISKSRPVTAPSTRVDDLRSRKAQLLEQLRELEDTGSATDGERAELEQQAALVLRELAEAEGATGDVVAAGNAEGAAAQGGSTPLRWAVRAAIGASVVALVGLALWQGVRPRQEGMGITGNDSAGSPSPSGGMTGEGHPTEGEASPIRPNETPRLQQARAAVEANPNSIDALVELGYALAEAGGWIDLYQNAQLILSRDPNNADALVQSAMLRFAMRQSGQADALIDSVLAREPENVRALEVGGRLAMGTRNWSRAESLLSRAVDRLGPGSALDSLLQQVRREAARAPAVPVATPEPARGTASSAGAEASSGAVVGTVRLRAGVSLPQGGVLYVMARPAGVTVGPPVAVRRLAPSNFPLSFRIDGSNAMMGGTLPPKLSLSARLDLDGNVATKQPGDLVGIGPSSVDLGATGVEIVLQPAGG